MVLNRTLLHIEILKLLFNLLPNLLIFLDIQQIQLKLLQIYITFFQIVRYLPIIELLLHLQLVLQIIRISNNFYQFLLQLRYFRLRLFIFFSQLLDRFMLLKQFLNLFLILFISYAIISHRFQLSINMLSFQYLYLNL